MGVWGCGSVGVWECGNVAGVWNVAAMFILVRNERLN